MTAPYVTRVVRNPAWALDRARFPGNLPFVESFPLQFETPVTFFVGENGSGKSTLLEAIAVSAGLPISGGGTNEIGARHGIDERSELARAIRVGFVRRPMDGYFFRAELQAHFASLLEERFRDPAFSGDPLKNPYRRYGGQSLHAMSHGEAFLSVMQNRFTDGLFILDEPESALSPQRQLTLLALIYDRVQRGRSQFVIATHSPVLLTYPEARIVSFDDPALPTIALEDTQHYRITRGILTSPESYWKHLREVED